MPQLDIYLFTSFVWSSLSSLIVVYVLISVYVNTNLYLGLNLKNIKRFIETELTFEVLEDYKKKKKNEVLKKFFRLNKKKMKKIKNIIIKKNIINIDRKKKKIYLNINRENKINKMIKLNIESKRLA